MIRILLIWVGLLASVEVCIAQYSTEIIDTWIETLPYDNPNNIDSILFWADRLESESAKIEYQRGINYAYRFKAYYYDFKGDIGKATELYLEFLKTSQSINHKKDVLSALSDLVYIYLTTGQNKKAKSLLMMTIRQSKNEEIDPRHLSIFYNNLGIIYKREDQLDSAAWAYNQSLIIKEEIDDLKGMSDLRINLSSLYIELGDNEKALKLVEDNLVYLGEDGNPSDIIYNLINKGAALLKLERYENAEASMLKAVHMAEEIKDLNLMQMSTSSLAGLYSQSNQHEKAYNYLLESQRIKADLFNEESNIKIAELREGYEADKREQENDLLAAKVEAQKTRLTFYAFGIIGLALLLSILTWFWRTNKAKNVLLEQMNGQVKKQNQGLTLLNTEKNNLISMVSHDLSTPFSTIKIWAQGLNEDSSPTDIIETKDTITHLSDMAMKSIGQILTIDDEEISKLELEEIKIDDLLTEVVLCHKVMATQKTISIGSEVEPKNLITVSDRAILMRILDNLTSNAVKYTGEGGEVLLTACQKEDMLIFKVRDTGVGISDVNQQRLFGRYITGNDMPTNGESSHGLGLSIVKRLVDELGGVITLNSEMGVGSTFIIRLPS